MASWRAQLITTAGAQPRMLMQFCHGAPGFVICLADLHSTSLDALLQRARAFAMHGIAQTHAERARRGQVQYSLWTGDSGFAIYLRDGLTGVAKFPTLDVKPLHYIPMSASVLLALLACGPSCV